MTATTSSSAPGVRKLQIWTSALAIAEVYKVKCDQAVKALAEEKDRQFEQYIDQGFVVVVQVDRDIAVTARKLCRAHPKLKKPTDAIHLATAATWNLDELHTFDNENLLPLDGSIARSDGKSLKICMPPARPPFSRGQDPLFHPT